MNPNYFYSLLLCICIGAYTTVNAQSASLSITDQSKFEIDGTSTLTDWTVVANNVSGEIQLDGGEVKFSPASIQGASVRIPVAEMDGGRGKAMNDKILKALKSDTHPELIYELKQVTPTEEQEQGFIPMETQGTLEIAGVSKEVSIPVSATVMEDGILAFKGNYKMKFSEWSIEPPSAMFGQIVTGDEITIRFSLFVKL